MRIRRLVRSLFLVATMSTTFFVATSASAGELKLSSAPLEVDDDGKITKAGRAAATKELLSAPGEHVWSVSLWAKIDRGAEGPLYVEFLRENSGGKLMAYRYDYDDYGGEKYLSLDIELSSDLGFRPDDKLIVEVVQIATNDKRLKHASSKLKLVENPDKGAPAAAEQSDADDESAEPDASAQDELDGFGDDEETSAPPPPPTAPPPIEPQAKPGCAITGTNTGTLPPIAAGVLFLGLLAWSRRR